MPVQRAFIFSFMTLMIIITMSCATQGILSGGEKDTSPPLIDSLKSTPNLQTNFRPTEVELHFDEFIKLSNPAKEIVVSPPLNYPLITTSRGKKIKVVINKKDTLKENATYSINFGNAIQDYNEGNKLSNFNFVFSTGDYIDSLSISGTVTNAYTKEPIDQALVLVYDNLSDSIIYKERPFYFARTDKDGNYKINNIKNDTFKIFSITDQNLNYYKDENEEMGFLDSIIILTDSSANSFSLEIFPLDPVLDLISKDTKEPGIIRMLFNKEMEEAPDFIFSDEIEYDYGIEKDSLWIWYDTIGLSSPDLYMLNDTIAVKPKFKKTARTKKISFPKVDGNIPFNNEFQFSCSHPIISFDKNLITLNDTSEISLDYDLEIDSLDRRLISIKHVWQSDIFYKLTIADSAFITRNSIYNDSIKMDFATIGQENLGTIRFNLTEMDSSAHYVLILVDKDENIQEWSIDNQNETSIVIENMMPKEYKFYFIEDLNDNNKWDTGNFEDKKQAEQIVLKKMEKLKANWELEIPITPSILKQ